MFRKTLHFPVLVAFTCCIVSAQQGKPPEAQKPATVAIAEKAADYSQEAFVVEKQAFVYRFENDGRGYRRETSRFRVQSEAALQALGQLVFDYSSATEKLKVNYVRVIKSDGSVIAAGENAVQDMTAPVAREAPVYSDLRQKHVTVPSLRPGEVLEYEIEVEQAEPLAPGQFWMEHTFQKDAISLHETLELNIPSDRKIQLKSEPGFEPKVTEQGGRKSYQWTSSHLLREDAKKKKDAAAKKKSDRPDVAVTTFGNWDELAKWYSGLEQERRTASPEVAEKAKELTKNAKTEREKVEAIYDYVSQNYRYVSLSFGIGRYQPHAASEIFANEYGDCKDKHTLLTAMLGAVGVHADTILIHSSRKLDKDIASPSQFDHVITAAQVDGQRVILDTTAEVAPYGMLWQTLRSKDALLVLSSGKSEIIKTPADVPSPELSRVEVDGKITELGRLERRVRYAMRGDIEMALRSVLRKLPQPKWNELMQTVAMYDGMMGEVKDVKVDGLNDIHKPLVVEFMLTTPNFLDFSAKKSKIGVSLPTIQMPVADEDEKDPYPLGGTGATELSLRLTIPERFKVTAPLPITVKRDYAEFQSTYSVSNGVITAKRTVKVLKPQVESSRASDVNAFRNVVMKDAQQEFSVALSETATAEAPKDADADELNDAADAAFGAKNYKLAAELWKRVTELEPKHKSAWNNLGRAYLNMAKFDDAEEAIQKEIAINPYDEYAYNNLGLVYQRTGRFDEAEESFKKQIEINPLDRYAHSNLGQLLVRQHQYGEAIPELEQALSISGESTSLQQVLGDAYLRTGKTEKAMEQFDKVLNASPTPMMWNNVAYSLADQKQELDRAEKYAKTAVSMTTASLKTLPMEQMLQTGTALTNSLAAYWDTLGWVYFQQGNFKEAEKYIKASWQLAESGEVGDHLGQIYEKAGNKQQAIEMYAKSMSTVRTVPETRERLAKLVGDKKLQETLDSVRAQVSRDRATMIGKAEVDGSAQFKLVMRGAAVENASWIKGSENLKTYAEKLKSYKYPGSFPDPDTRVILQTMVNCSRLNQKCNLVLLSSEVMVVGSPSDVPKDMQEILQQLNQMNGSDDDEN